MFVVADFVVTRWKDAILYQMCWACLSVTVVSWHNCAICEKGSEKSCASHE